MLTVKYLLPHLPTAFKIQILRICFPNTVCVHHFSVTMFAFLCMFGSEDDFQLLGPSV